MRKMHLRLMYIYYINVGLLYDNKYDNDNKNYS